MSTFFGLTPSYRSIVFQQIHDLVYHGGGGFIHSEVYNMPIWLRSFHIHQLNEYHKKQNEELEKAKKGSNTDNSFAKGPSVNPSSVYNFKK